MLPKPLSVELNLTAAGRRRAIVRMGTFQTESTGSLRNVRLPADVKDGLDAIMLQLGTGLCNRYNGMYELNQRACDLWDWFWS